MMEEFKNYTLDSSEDDTKVDQGLNIIISEKRKKNKDITYNNYTNIEKENSDKLNKNILLKHEKIINHQDQIKMLPIKILKIIIVI